MLFNYKFDHQMFGSCRILLIESLAYNSCFEIMQEVTSNDFDCGGRRGVSSSANEVYLRSLGMVAQRLPLILTTIGCMGLLVGFTEYFLQAYGTEVPLRSRAQRQTFYYSALLVRTQYFQYVI